jgi:hypothetical protein
MDDTVGISRNLDTLSRRTAEAIAAAQAALEDGKSDYQAPIRGGDQQQTFDEVSDAQDLVRAQKHWEQVDLRSCLSPELVIRFEEFQAHQRERWTKADFLVVGIVGLLGTLASVFDDALDAQIQSGLAWLKETDLVHGWEQAGKNLSIDYTGPNFGGFDHRQKSIGHDIGRPFSALRQIRDGYFGGTYWVGEEKITFIADGYQGTDGLGVALALWLQHLGADFVTPMSLPLPGWTLIQNMPSERVRDLGAALYRGSRQTPGYNMRSGMLAPGLSVLTVETVIRTHIHTRAYSRRQTFSLNPSEKAKLNEMLLAGQGCLAGASLGSAVFRGFFGEGIVAVRHVNVPALLRTGVAAVTVASDARTRSGLSPDDWRQLTEKSLLRPRSSLVARELEAWASGQ